MHANPDRERRAPADGTWLPNGALPCVWMAAGLLAYHLCERDFDCERCPLDAALAGRAPRADAASEPAEPAHERRRAPLRFRADRGYHDAHGWVLRLSPLRVRTGLDMFAARLLARSNAVVLPPLGCRVERGRPACWIADEGELIPLRSPVSGTVVGRNVAVQERPGLLASSPYDEGWLLEVRCDAPPEDGPALRSAGHIRRDTARQLRRLRARVRTLGRPDPRVGATLADGGRRVTDLRVLLGPLGWRRAIDAVLG